MWECIARNIVKNYPSASKDFQIKLFCAALDCDV